MSQYSIYDGFKDKVIVPPKIVWVKSEKEPPINDLMFMIKREISKLPYKKIIVWCGMIDECKGLADKWSKYFPKFDICLDFNNINKHNSKYESYNHFYECKNNAILFCAVKHREGSDIPK